MNCNDFEKFVSDLAQHHLMEAGKREMALQHTKGCARCNARLYNERVLSASLSAAANAETESAPANIKANLLAAFNEKHSTNSTNVVALTSKKESSNYFWKLAAAAAIVIAFLGIAAMRFVLPASDTTLQQAAKSSDIKNVEIKKQEYKNESPRTPFEKDKGNSVARRDARANTPRRGNKSIENANNNEIASDFIALTYTDETSSGNNGMVVRVKLPRATVIAMGLPLNANHTDGYVKADVLVGDDGVARAIRLVQNSSDTDETEK